MSQIILNFLRRKIWILGTGFLIEGLLGWFSNPSSHLPLSSLIAFQLQIGVVMGSLLLATDLQRGFPRVVLTLPLSRRKLGQACWLMSVGWPILIYSTAALLGMLLHRAINPAFTLHWDWLGTSFMFLSLWMGMAFTILFFNGAAALQSWWRRLLFGIIGAVWGALIGGSFFLVQSFTDNPGFLPAIIAIGLPTCLYGWFRAENLLVNRAGSKLAASDSGTRRHQTHARLERGFGGPAYLIGTITLRAVRMALAMMVLFFVFMTLSTGWIAL